VNSTETGLLAFTFSTCSTPEIIDIQVRPSTDRYVFAFYGEGLGDDVCQVTVSFLSIALTVTGTNGSVVTAELYPSDDLGLVIGVEYDLKMFTTMNVYGLGDVDMNVEGSRTVVFQPSVSSYSPQEGSCEGSAILTISGMFLSDDQSSSYVSLVGVGTCTVISDRNTELVCLTPPLTSGLTVPISVSVNTAYGTISATTEETMNFTCSAATTPTLGFVSPTYTDGRDEIFINGTGFGSDPSALIVSIGGVLLCTNIACDDTNITCTLDHSFAGIYTNGVTVVRNPYGLASGTGSITLDPVIDSYSATNGGLNGGLRMYVTGIGFNPDTITAWRISPSEGISEIPVESASYFHVEFITPPHVNETVYFALNSGITFPIGQFTYGVEFTPVVASIIPEQGAGGDPVYISGTGFSANCTLNVVNVCGAECTVMSCNETGIECLIGHCPSGVYDVDMNVGGKGLADTSAQFTFTLSISSVSPLLGKFCIRSCCISRKPTVFI
jgi:hypothetical protein